jgi:glucuronokinase
MITSRVFARIGLLGNPSDGYDGKCIALSLENYFAEVGRLEGQVAVMSFSATA